MGPAAPLQPTPFHPADGDSWRQRSHRALGSASFSHPLCFQQQKKKRDARKGRRKKDVDDEEDEKELLERLKKLSVPASDEEDEGK